MQMYLHRLAIPALAAVLLLTGCGPSAGDQDATTALETAEAQPDVSTPISPQPTETPAAQYTQIDDMPEAVTPDPSGVTAGSDRAALDGETVPDLTPMFPGHLFVKTWTLRNAGTTTWTTDYALVFVGGTQMNAEPEVYLPVPVEPGAQVDVSVLMRAPYTVGVYQGFWKLRNDEGQLFGVGADGSGSIWVKVVCSPEPTKA